MGVGFPVDRAGIGVAVLGLGRDGLKTG